LSEELRLRYFRTVAGEGAVHPPRLLRRKALFSWRKFETELSDLWDGDLSYGRQIRAVARELSLRGRLAGEEVRAAMAAA
jgi:hypothetical protein